MNASANIIELGKICRDCKARAPTAVFPTGGYSGRCVDCKNVLKRQQRRLRCENVPGHRERLVAYAQKYQSTPTGAAKIKDYHVRRKYGISYAEMLSVLERQHGLCANRACGTAISVNAPKASPNQAVIDHDHVTGKFRAVLCFRCNMKLGHIEKDKNLTVGLLEYMDKHAG